MVIVLQVKLFAIGILLCPSKVGVRLLVELGVMKPLHLKNEAARLHRKRPDMAGLYGVPQLENEGVLYLEITMADSFLEASPRNGGDVQLDSGGSSDEYERMTAAEVLEKLEEVR